MSDRMDFDDIRKILDLVREHDLAEFELERDGLKIRVRKAGPVISVAPPVMPMSIASWRGKLESVPTRKCPRLG